MPELGEVVGHYRIEQKLGAGGMGVVYRAQDQQLERQVALKFLARELVDHPEGLKRFKNEALAAAELDHPNLATVYDVELGPEHHYLAMEYLDGEDLYHIVRGEPLGVERILQVMKEVTRGLIHAHERGVIHRDIKSANIFLTKSGAIKILDFGLAHRIDATRITRAGTTLGTVGYMSPEQVKGQPADVRSDIWSLGVVLYECATGQLPFEGESFVAVSNLICSADPVMPSSLGYEFPRELESIIGRCLQKDVALRYQHADELLAELHRAERSLLPDSAAPTPFHLRAPRWLRESWRRRVVHTAMAYAGAAMILSAAVGVAMDRLRWSPDLTSAVQLCAALLAPSALFLSWRRGGPWAGRRPWNPIDLSAVPANLLLVTVFLLFGFRERTLGPVQTQVQVPDAAGVLSTRLVPKPAFRRHVSTFYYDNRSGRSDLDWLSFALHDLVSTDLGQDAFIELRTPLLQRDRFAADGHADGLNLPRPYARELARAQNSDHFVTAAFDMIGDELEVTTVLHDVARGRVVAERNFRGSDPRALADEISVQLRRDLGIPDWQIEESEDLPVEDMESSSLEAIRLATEGMRALYLDRAPAEATARLDAALELDPTYAAAQLLSFVAWNSPDHPRRDPQRAAQALDATLQHLYRFSERQRLAVQATAALVRQDIESSLNVNRSRTLLFPDDPQAHETLGRILVLSDRPEDALVEFERALSLDPQRVELLLRIGELRERAGQPERALGDYRRLSRARPSDAEAYGRSARLLLELGRRDEAAEAILQAVALAPQETRWRELQATITENGPG